MNSHCRSLPSFFAQPLCDLETLRAQTFFLLYYGNGYTKESVDTMSFDEMQWHVNRLREQLEAEKKSQKTEAAKAKARIAAARRR